MVVYKAKTNDGCEVCGDAIIKTRGECSFLPDMDSYGNMLKPYDTILVDTFAKIDTGVYGEIYVINPDTITSEEW